MNQCVVCFTNINKFDCIKASFIVKHTGNCNKVFKKV